MAGTQLTPRGKAALAIVAVLAVIVAAVWLTGGSDNDGPGPATVPTRKPTPTPSAPVALLPLTGQPAAKGAPDRPAVIVKVDNTGRARPQIGLSAADLIVEEPAEGGATRLAVFYHSRLPELVGPVRSLRTSDIGIVAPTGGLLVASGGAQIATRRVAGAGIPLAPFEGVGSARDLTRPVPYNLFVKPAEVLAATPPLPHPPNYLSWRLPGDPDPSPSARPVRRLEARLTHSHTTRWRYAGRRGWVRVDDFAPASDRFVADNIVVLHVKTRSAGYRDPAGNAVPEAVTTGSGEALLLFGGTAIPARWRKDDAVSQFVFTSPDGAELSVPPGRTWVELVPQDGAAKVS
jgi:hypothetical protein